MSDEDMTHRDPVTPVGGETPRGAVDPGQTLRATAAPPGSPTDPARLATGALQLARGCAAVSVVSIVVVFLAANSPHLAFGYGLAYSLPFVALARVLDPTGRPARLAWALELAASTGVVALVGFGLFSLDWPGSGLPLGVQVAAGLFPLAQLGLINAAQRAKRTVPKPRRVRTLRLLLAVSGLAYLLTVAVVVPLTAHPGQRAVANERLALREVRSMIRAQAAFRSSFGWFAPLECLELTRGGSAEDPAALREECGLAGYQGPAYLTETETQGDRVGYHFALHGVPVGESARRLEAFAYTAVPLRRSAYPGWRRTGMRSLCGDSTGRMCAVEDGSQPPIEEGRCAASCTEVY